MARVVVVSIDSKGEIETKIFRGLSGVLTALVLHLFLKTQRADFSALVSAYFNALIVLFG